MAAVHLLSPHYLLLLHFHFYACTSAISSRHALRFPVFRPSMKLLILSHAMHTDSQLLRTVTLTSTSPKLPPLPSTVCVHSHPRTHPLALHSSITRCMSNRFVYLHVAMCIFAICTNSHSQSHAQALLVGEEAPVTPLASTSRVGVNDLTNGNLRVVVDPTTGCLKATRVSAHLMHACRRCLPFDCWFRWWTHTSARLDTMHGALLHCLAAIV
jgi:hypothetical protein